MGPSIFGWQALGSAIVQFAFIAVAAVLLAIPALAILRVLYRPKRRQMVESTIVLFVVSTIGIVVGDIGGLSRASAVGEIVPAVITLIGGFSVYLFGLKRAESKIVVLATLTFVLTFFIGYTYAAILRTDAEAFDFCKSKYSEAAILANPAALQSFNTQFSAYCTDIIGRHTRPSGKKP